MFCKKITCVFTVGLTHITDRKEIYIYHYFLLFINQAMGFMIRFIVSKAQICEYRQIFTRDTQENMQECVGVSHRYVCVCV